MRRLLARAARAAGRLAVLALALGCLLGDLKADWYFRRRDGH